MGKPDGVYGNCGSCQYWGTDEQRSMNLERRNCCHPVLASADPVFHRSGGCAWRKPIEEQVQ